MGVQQSDYSDLETTSDKFIQEVNSKKGCGHVAAYHSAAYASTGTH